METDLDESYLQKIKGLRQTEDKFKTFLSVFPNYRDEEHGRISEKVVFFLRFIFSVEFSKEK